MLPVYDEAFRVVVPARHAVGAQEDACAADELDADELLLLPAGHCLRDQVLDTCHGVLPSAAARAAGQLARDAAQHGRLGPGRDGAARDRAHPALRDAAGEVDRLLPRRHPKRRVALAWRRGFSRPAAVRKLAEAIRGLDLPVTPLAEPERDRAV